jgi:hypothetical protein
MWYGFKRPGEPFVMAGFPVETVREILAQNKEGVLPDVDLNMADEPVVAEKAPDYENVVGQDDLTRFDSRMKSGKKRSRGKGKGRERGPGGGATTQREGRSSEATTGPAPRPERNAAGPEGDARKGTRERNDRGRRDRGRGRGERPSGGQGPKPPAA